MTYREEIQKLISDLDSVHDRAGWLRDVAVSKEKDVFSDVRQEIRQVITLLYRFDNNLPDKRAQMEL